MPEIHISGKLYVSCNNIHNNQYSNNKDIGINTFKDASRLFFIKEWISYYKQGHTDRIFNIWSKKMLSTFNPLLHLFKQTQKIKDTRFIEPIRLNSEIVKLKLYRNEQLFDYDLLSTFITHYIDVGVFENTTKTEDIVKDGKVVGKRTYETKIENLDDHKNYNITLKPYNKFYTVSEKENCYTNGDGQEECHGFVDYPEADEVTSEGELFTEFLTHFKRYSKGYTITENQKFTEQYKHIIAAYLSQEGTKLKYPIKGNKYEYIYNVINTTLNGYPSDKPLPDIVGDTFEYKTKAGKTILAKSFALQDIDTVMYTETINNEYRIRYVRTVVHEEDESYVTFKPTTYAISTGLNKTTINPAGAIFYKNENDTGYKPLTDWSQIDNVVTDDLDNWTKKFFDFMYTDNVMFIDPCILPEIFYTAYTFLVETAYLEGVGLVNAGASKNIFGQIINRGFMGYSNKNPLYTVFQSTVNVKKTVKEIIYDTNQETITQEENKSYQRTFLYYNAPDTYRTKLKGKYPNSYVDLNQIFKNTDIESVASFLHDIIFYIQNKTVGKDIWYPTIKLVVPETLKGDGVGIVHAEALSYPVQYTKPDYGNLSFKDKNKTYTMIHNVHTKNNTSYSNPFYSVVESSTKYDPITKKYYKEDYAYSCTSTIPMLFIPNGKIILFLKLIFKERTEKEIVSGIDNSITIQHPKKFISSRIKVMRVLPDDKPVDKETEDTITINYTNKVYKSEIDKETGIYYEYKTVVCEIDVNPNDTITSVYNTKTKETSYRILTGKTMQIKPEEGNAITAHLYGIKTIRLGNKDILLSEYQPKIKDYMTRLGEWRYPKNSAKLVQRKKDEKLVNRWLNNLGFNLNTFVFKYDSGNKFLEDSTLSDIYLLPSVTYNSKTYYNTVKIKVPSFPFKEYLNYTTTIRYYMPKYSKKKETVTRVYQTRDDYQFWNTWNDPEDTAGRHMSLEDEDNQPVVPCNSIIIGISMYLFKNITEDKTKIEKTVKLSWISDGEKFYLFEFFKYLIKLKLGVDDLISDATTDSVSLNFYVSGDTDADLNRENNAVKIMHGLFIKKLVYKRTNEFYSRKKQGILAPDYTPSSEIYKLEKVDNETVRIINTVTKEITEATFDTSKAAIWSDFRLTYKNEPSWVKDKSIYGSAYADMSLWVDTYSESILFPLSYEIFRKAPVWYKLQIFYNSIKFYDYKLAIETHKEPTTLEKVGMAILGLVIAIIGLVISIVSFGAATPVGAILMGIGIGLSVVSIAVSLVSILLFVTGAISEETYRKLQIAAGIIDSVGSVFSLAGQGQIVEAAIAGVGVAGEVAIQATNEALEQQFEKSMKALEDNFKDFQNKMEARMDVLDKVKDELNSKNAVTLDSFSVRSILGIKRISDGHIETPTQFFNRTKNISNNYIDTLLNFQHTSIQNFVKMSISLY